MAALEAPDLFAERRWGFLSVLPATLMVFLIGPLLRPLDSVILDTLLRLSFDGCVFLGMWAYSPSRRVRFWGLGLVAVSALTSALAAAGLLGPAPYFLLGILSSTALAVLSLVVQLASLLRARHVTAAHIASAVFSFLLIGLLFSFVYLLLWLGSAESAFAGVIDRADFVGATDANSAESLSLRGQVTDRLVYFSFVTLTTLGYGDIAPRGSIAPGLATFEALIGQLFLTILVAHLVSLNIARQTKESTD